MFEVWHIDLEDEDNSRVVECFDDEEAAETYAKGLRDGYSKCRADTFEVEVKPIKKGKSKKMKG